MKVPEYNAPQVGAEQLAAPMQRTPSGVQAMEGIAAQTTRQGEQIKQAGEQFMQAEAIKREIDVKQQDVQLTDNLTKMLYDPESGFMNQKGQNAIGAASITKENITKFAQAMADDIQDPTAREMFMQTAHARVSAAVAQMDGHTSRELQVAAQNQSNARSAASMNAAVASYNPMPGADNSMYQQNLAAQQVELEHQADNLGLTGQARTDYVMHGADGRSGLQATYVSTFSHLLENDQTKAADKYLEQIQKELPPLVADKLRDQLKVGHAKDNSLALSIKLRAEVPDLGAQEKRLDQMFQNKEITSDEYDMTLSRLRADDSQRKGILQEKDKNFMGRLWGLKKQNPNASIADLSAGQMAYIKQRGLGPAVDALFARGPGTDDPRMYMGLIESSYKDPKGFLNQDFVRMYPFMSEGHQKALERRREEILAADPKAADVSRRVHDSMGLFRNNIAAAGIDPNKDPEKMAALEAQLYDALSGEIAKDPNVSNDRLRQITLGYLNPSTLKDSGLIWDTKKPVYEMTPEEKLQQWEIPDADRAQITEALQRNGIPVSEAAIQMYYKRGQGVDVNAIMAKQQKGAK